MGAAVGSTRGLTVGHCGATGEGEIPIVGAGLRLGGRDGDQGIVTFIDVQGIDALGILLQALGQLVQFGLGGRLAGRGGAPFIKVARKRCFATHHGGGLFAAARPGKGGLGLLAHVGELLFQLGHLAVQLRLAAAVLGGGAFALQA